MDVGIVNFLGESVGTKSADFLKVENINTHLIWEVVKAENANLRQGTHKTKERGEVRGGGAKPWRQKGTGRARAGSNRSPIWKGGGTIFGPRPRDYREDLPRKKKRAGIREILSDKLLKEKIVILKEISINQISTKEAYNGMFRVVKGSPFFEEYSKKREIKGDSNKPHRKITVIFNDNNDVIKKSLRNLPWINYIHVSRMAACPIFYSHGVVFTEAAFDELKETLRKA